MTREEINNIRNWLQGAAFSSDCSAKFAIEYGRAVGHVARLVEEVERLHAACDEITRQYIRLSQQPACQAAPIVAKTAATLETPAGLSRS
jgi:hypothetical protein